MTVEKLLITLASAGAVLALIFIAWALGFRDAVRLAGEDDVRRAIDGYEPGAAVEAMVIDAGGGAALARLADGRLAVLRAMGDGLAVRVLPAGAARVRISGQRVIATFGDLGFPRIEIRLDGAPPGWLAPLMDERA